MVWVRAERRGRRRGMGRCIVGLGKDQVVVENEICMFV